MENTPNQRVILLKKELKLTDIEFCVRCSISTGTLFRLKNEEEMSSKTITAIIKAFNVNKEWLMTGQGNMFNDSTEAIAIDAIDPWRDALVSQVKEENTRLQKELERVWQMVQHLTGGAKPNFLKPIAGSDPYEGQLLGAA